MKYNTPVADEVRVHEISRAEYTIDTVNGQPLVDLIVEVEDKTGSSPASTGPGKYLNAWSLLESAAPGRPSQCGTRGFLEPTDNPQSTDGPSRSARLMAAPSSVGPAVFLGSAPTRHATKPFDGTTLPRGGGVSAPTAGMMCLVEQPPPP